MKKYLNTLILASLIVGNVVATSGELAPFTVLFCAVVAMVWPVADLLEALSC